MAGTDHIAVNEGWSWISYTGAHDDLIAAGFLRQEWIRPKPYKNATLKTMLPDGREIRVYKKADKIEVRHYFSEAEQEARRLRGAALRDAEAERGKADAEVAKWPTSKVDFARRLESAGCAMLQFVHDFARDGVGGYRVAPASMVEINETLLGLVRAMRDAEIDFDPAARAKAEALLRSKAASHDPAFGAFLDRVMAGPEDGEVAGGAS